MKRSDIETIMGAHENYWATNKKYCIDYHDAYRQRMFRSTINFKSNSENAVINTADGYTFVEGYVASLFAKSPAVSVRPGIDAKGDSKVAETVINNFLKDKHECLETGLRNALIFPASYFKVFMHDCESITDTIGLVNVQPWNIIVDMNQDSWDTQRYVGHRYYIPIDEAKKRWPSSQWRAGMKTDFLVWNEKDNKNSYSMQRGSFAETYNSKNTSNASTLLTYVEIIEFYNLQDDELVFYSKNYDAKENIMETIQIPFRKADGTALVPISPLYLSKDPQVPLKGMSTLGRVYDQLFEKNALRTIWANGMRKNARVYLTRKGVLDEEAKAKIAANIDNSVIEVDLPMDEDINGLIVPVPNQNFSSDYSVYENTINSDLQNGSVLAPFARGIPTNASATEVAALSQYTTTEIGRLNRNKDYCIERIAEIYLSLMKEILENKEEGEKFVIYIDGAPIVLTSEDFSGRFKIFAADQSQTPLNSAVKRQNFMGAIPLLLQLGVPQENILKQLVRELDLPEEILTPVARAEQVGAPAEIEQGQSTDNPQSIPVGGGQVATNIRQGGE